MTPYMRLKELHKRLEYHMMLNRIVMHEYEAGLRTIRGIEAEMQLIQKLEAERKAKKHGHKK